MYSTAWITPPAVSELQKHLKDFTGEPHKERCPMTHTEPKEYWETRRQEWEKHDHTKGIGYRMYEELLSTVVDTGGTALEIGFGDGRWMSYLRDKGITSYGIDIVENAAIHVKKEGFSPVVADARDLPFKKDTFDLTYSFGVVEHFEDTEKAIREHVRVTRPGGRIVITVPYLVSPYTVYWMLIHVKRGTFKKRPATFGKRYTRRKFRTMLEKTDVTILRLDPFMFPIPKFRKVYHTNPVLNRFGVMLWAEMIKNRTSESRLNCTRI
jgi:SAM-dependent methyltransferase